MNKLFITKWLLSVVLLLSGISSAQQKLTKLSQAINVDDQAVIDLNTSYCNIIFDTWNKDVVEIEAYIESDKLSDTDLKEALKNWKVDIDATKTEVQIATRGSSPKIWVQKFGDEDSEEMHAIVKELKFAIADAPDIEFDYDIITVPEVPESPELPALPELPKDIGNMQFDYQAYQKDGEAYLEAYSKQLEKTFGKEFQEKMKDWGERFEKEWEAKYAKKIEAMEENLEAQMEQQEDNMRKHHEQIIILHDKNAEAMEERLKLHEKQRLEHEKLADERRVIVEKIVTDKSSSDVKKTIKIKIPKNAKVKLNVRHGLLEVASAIDNIKANLSYTKLVANSINGSNTSINVSYAPVKIANWDVGELNLNYVEDAKIDQVKQMVLTANSSNVHIDELTGHAVINGSIGDLNIAHIADTFSNLNVILQNSDAFISLPKAAYNLQYVGNHTRFKHPQRSSQDQSATFSTGPSNSAKSIMVNAKFSNVTMQ